MSRTSMIDNKMPLGRLNDYGIMALIKNFMKLIGENKNKELQLVFENIFKKPFIQLEPEEKHMFSTLVPTEILNFLLSCTMLLLLDLRIIFEKHAIVSLQFETIPTCNMLSVLVSKNTIDVKYELTKFISMNEFKKKTPEVIVFHNHNCETIKFDYASLIKNVYVEGNILVIKTSSSFHEKEKIFSFLDFEEVLQKKEENFSHLNFKEENFSHLHLEEEGEDDFLLEQAIQKKEEVGKEEEKEWEDDFLSAQTIQEILKEEFIMNQKLREEQEKQKEIEVDFLFAQQLQEKDDYYSALSFQEKDETLKKKNAIEHQKKEDARIADLFHKQYLKELEKQDQVFISKNFK